MAISLASLPIFHSKPVCVSLRLFGALRFAGVPRQALAVPLAAARFARPDQACGDPEDWTAEEQRFLRALREAGL